MGELQRDWTFGRWVGTINSKAHVLFSQCLVLAKELKKNTNHEETCDKWKQQKPLEGWWVFPVFSRAIWGLCQIRDVSAWSLMKKPVIQRKLLRSLGGSLGGFHVSDQFNVAVLLVHTEVIVLLSTNWQSNYIHIYIYIWIIRIDNKSSFQSIFIHQAVSV